jgi:hypothetical protein
MKKISGLVLVVIGLLHSLTALVMPGAIGFSEIWKEIIDVGVVDALKSDSLRIWGYYWFLISGFFMIIYGLLCHWVENQLNSPLPSFIGWGLLLVSIFGIVMDIGTGFWLVLLIAINIIVSSQRGDRSRQSDSGENIFR